jgi:hypothetical protein
MKQRVADHACRQGPEGAAVLWSLASLVVLFGVLGLLDVSWPKRVLGSWVNLHAIFGLLLWIFVAARFHSGLKVATPMRPADIRSLSRELSRTVYLLLYAVIGIREIIGVVGWLWHSGTWASGEFAADAELQAVIAYGLIGLLLIRALAFGTAMAGGAAIGKPSDRSVGQLRKT